MVKQWLVALFKQDKTKPTNIIAIKSSYNIDELGDSFIPVHLLKP